LCDIPSPLQASSCHEWVHHCCISPQTPQLHTPNPAYKATNPFSQVILLRLRAPHCLPSFVLGFGANTYHVMYCGRQHYCSLPSPKRTAETSAISTRISYVLQAPSHISAVLFKLLALWLNYLTLATSSIRSLAQIALPDAHCGVISKNESTGVSLSFCHVKSEHAR